MAKFLLLLSINIFKSIKIFLEQKITKNISINVFIRKKSSAKLNNDCEYSVCNNKERVPAAHTILSKKYI